MGFLYRKKKNIHAWQFLPGTRFADLPVFLGEGLWANKIGIHYAEDGSITTITIHTLEGTMLCTHGCWLAMGDHGDYWPIQDHIFKDTYEAVDV